MAKRKLVERCETCKRALRRCHCKAVQTGIVWVKKHSSDCMQSARCACPLVPVDEIKKK